MESLGQVDRKRKRQAHPHRQKTFRDQGDVRERPRNRLHLSLATGHGPMETG